MSAGLPFEVEVVQHTDWCNTQLGYVGDGLCDCDGGRCPVCGKHGPCGFTDDGEPLICVGSADVQRQGDTQ